MAVWWLFGNLRWERKTARLQERRRRNAVSASARRCVGGGAGSLASHTPLKLFDSRLPVLSQPFYPFFSAPRFRLCPRPDSCLLVGEVPRADRAAELINEMHCCTAGALERGCSCTTTRTPQTPWLLREAQRRRIISQCLQNPAAGCTATAC